MIKASVIMPVLNGEKYLKESLDSIINQTERNIEILCVDDGSSDKTLSILESYANSDSRIKIFKQDKLGFCAARNKGIEASQGEYLYFFDSGNLCKNELLEKTVRKADETNADVVAFNGEKFWDDGRKETQSGFNKKSLPPGKDVFTREDSPDLIIQRIENGIWNKLFRADFIKENGIKFEDSLSNSDIKFCVACNVLAGRTAFIDEKLHENRNSLSQSQNPHNVKDAVDSIERLVKGVPYFENIKNSLVSFVIESLTNFINDSDTAADFKINTTAENYDYAHDKFNQREYLEGTEYIKSNPSLYYKYLCIRNSNYNELQEMKRCRVIVSVTSFPARIKFLATSLKSILSQTEQPDKIIVYLSKDQFLNLEKDLPQDLLNLVEEGKTEIRWVEDDLRPHKKYFYAFQEFPDDLIVTFDDDLIFDSKIIEALHKSYFQHPQCVSGVRCHIISVDDNKQILPYEYWIKSTDRFVHMPNHQLLITGGAGALYPANLFQSQKIKQMLDISLIKELCLNADDLWLKAVEVLNDIPVVLADRNLYGLHYIPNSQDVALFKSNVEENKNDLQLKNIMDWIVKNHGEDLFTKKIVETAALQLPENPLSRSFLCTLINDFPTRQNRRCIFADEYNVFKNKARIDVKNFGKATNAIQILSCSDSSFAFTSPNFLNDIKGSGQFIEPTSGKLSFSFKVIGDGDLSISLKAPCFRDSNKSIIPFGICYTDFVVNNKNIFTHSHIQNHNSPYVYKQRVNDGEIFDCTVCWNNVDFVNTELKNFDSDNVRLTKEVDKFKTHNTELMDERDKIKKEVARLTDELNESKKNNACLSEERDKIRRKSMRLSEEVKKIKSENASLKNSVSYKIGRLITFVPRKFRGILRMLKKRRK